MDFNKMISRINRMYLFLLREMAIKHGPEKTANIAGTEAEIVEHISTLDPAEIEELAEIGFPIIQINVPLAWRELPSSTRKGWIISKILESQGHSTWTPDQ